MTSAIGLPIRMELTEQVRALLPEKLRVRLVCVCGGALFEGQEPGVVVTVARGSVESGHWRMIYVDNTWTPDMIATRLCLEM